MPLYTAGAAALLPEQVGPLIVQPVQRESVAFRVSTVVGGTSTTYRFPLVTEDPDAAWTPEGAEIAVSDAEIDELEVTPRKVAALSIVSRELAEDSEPGAIDIIGRGMVRDLARKIDAAFFGATTANGPDGIASADYQVVQTGGTITDLDPFAEALSLAENVGATITTWVTSPNTALELAKLKEASGSNRPLITPDATRPGARLIQGVELLVSPAVVDGDVWCIPRDFTYAVLRSDATIDVDRSAYFSSDRIGIRSTLRVGYAFPHPQSIVCITGEDGS